MKKIQIPVSDNKILEDLKAGDQVLLSGTIYTARDAACKRLVEMIENNEDLPFELQGRVIYFAGPAPAKPGKIVGSIGPTTSSRMNPYISCLIRKGLKGIIGKGTISDEVIDSLAENKAVYFCAIGGAGALLSEKIKSIEPIAFEYLCSEAVYKLEIEDFPVVVGVDCSKNSLYKSK